MPSILFPVQMQFNHILLLFDLNMAVQRVKVAILPLALPCSGPITHSGEILTTGKSQIYIDAYINI